MKRLIQQAAEVDTYRTLDYGYSIADFNDSFTKALDDHTPYGLKVFLNVRKKAMLKQLYPAGIADDGSEQAAQSIFPNPAREDITIVALDQALRVSTGTDLSFPSGNPGEVVFCEVY